MVWCGRVCIVVCVCGVGVCVSLCWVLLTQTAVYRRGKLGRSDDEQKHWLQYAVPKYSVSLCIIIIMCGPSEISFSHTGEVHGRCATVPTSASDAVTTAYILGSI